ncbi:hypothetical protein SAMN05444365_101265 [Micromonospora pattaloongensis]|uniref:Uncharacterized protein n=1 Tax=Micromonospora pattaloongensis TaxID=405436 RepID=A0A1H3G3I9_9ACTN|nr:hypothetical protein SAMN05444365_101265 [Micromonospora pattaloongensis]
METYTMNRPSALPAVWAPVSVSAGYAVDARPLTQAHQVQVQAELVRALPRVEQRHEISEFIGTSGFLGSEAIVTTVKKRLMDGARGVPPRGRPV